MRAKSVSTPAMRKYTLGATAVAPGDADPTRTASMHKMIKHRQEEVAPSKTAQGALPTDSAWFIVNPKSTALRRWDLGVLGLLAWTSIVTPTEVAFGGSTDLSVMFYINRLIDLAFLIDLVLNFITARFDSSVGRWVHNPKDIARMYLKSWFTVDLVSVLPFDILGLLINSDSVSQLRILRVVRLLRLMKLVRVLKASRILARWEHRIGVSYALLSLLRFIVTVTVVAHWMACVWRIVVEVEGHVDANGQPENWITDYGLGSASPWGELYMTSLYWSVMTITTIGFGDVVAVTVGERAVATLCMMLGASMYAYVVGAVCGIVGQMDEATSKFHSHMDQLNAYMEEFKLPQTMRENLRSYFLYCRALTRERNYKALLNDMSPELRGEVTLFCYSQNLRTVPFFVGNVEGLQGYALRKATEQAHQFITQIAMLIIPQAFPPNEMIIKVGDPAKAMYMIRRGIVAKRGTILGQGQYFGEDMLLEGYIRPYVVRSLTYLTCYSIRRSDLMSLFEHGQFPLIQRSVRKCRIRLLFRNKFVAYAKAYTAFERRELPVSPTKSRNLPAIEELSPPSLPTFNSVDHALASLDLPEVSDSESEDAVQRVSPGAQMAFGGSSGTNRFSSSSRRKSPPLPADKLRLHTFAKLNLESRASLAPEIAEMELMDQTAGNRDLAKRLARLESKLDQVLAVVGRQALRSGPSVKATPL